MGIKTTVARIAVVGGSLYDQPNNILVDERTAPFAKGRSRGNLYIILELSGSGTEHDAIAKQVLQAMRRTYYDQQGSVTSGLRQAVYEANDILVEENRHSLAGEQRLAGVSCVVLRGDDLFIAQAGPALVYLFHQGQGSRYPDSSPWLDGFAPEEVDAAALGERREPNVDLFHSQIGSGDTILLASSGLARNIAPVAWPRILSQSSVSPLLEDLRRQGGGFELSALVVRLADAAVDGGGAQPVAQAGTPDAARREAAPRGFEPGRRVPTLSPVESGRKAGERAPERVTRVPKPPPAQAERLEEQYEEVETGSIGARLAGTVAQIRLGERL